jgi:hypothetical protein
MCYRALRQNVRYYQDLETEEMTLVEMTLVEMTLVEMTLVEMEEMATACLAREFLHLAGPYEKITIHLPHYFFTASVKIFTCRTHILESITLKKD